MIEWNLKSNVADVLSLGPRTSAKLLQVGVQTVEQLLVAKPHVLGVRLADDRINWKTISGWQREAQLTLALPKLSSDALRLLAMADYTTPRQIANSSPTEMIARLESIEMEAEGLPGFQEIGEWISVAQETVKNRAA